MLNVCFGDSACGMLKYALKTKRVTHVFHTLDQGKIGPDLMKARKQWFSRFPLGESFFETEYANLKKILNSAKKGEDIYIWSSSAANAQCGLLCLVFLLQSCPCKLYRVDKPIGIDFRASDAESSLKELSPRDFPDISPFCHEISPEEKEKLCQEWVSLQSENAELRICINGKIQSVPTDFFDEEIMSHMPPSGDFSMARLVGNTIGNSKHSLSDFFITERIYAMIDQGKLILVSPCTVNYNGYTGAIIRKP